MRKIYLYTLLMMFTSLGYITYTYRLDGMNEFYCVQGYVIGGLILLIAILRSFADQEIKLAYSVMHYSCFILLIIIIIPIFQK